MTICLRLAFITARMILRVQLELYRMNLSYTGISCKKSVPFMWENILMMIRYIFDVTGKLPLIFIVLDYK